MERDLYLLTYARYILRTIEKSQEQYTSFDSCTSNSNQHRENPSTAPWSLKPERNALNCVPFNLYVPFLRSIYVPFSFIAICQRLVFFLKSDSLRFISNREEPVSTF
jgi:hypothetical protein